MLENVSFDAPAICNLDDMTSGGNSQDERRTGTTSYEKQQEKFLGTQRSIKEKESVLSITQGV